MIETVPETGSTNGDLLARLRAGGDLAEGHWLLADRQTSGRGRQGREWSDAPGNFMGSTVVRLGEQERCQPGLALVAGLAVYETVLPRLTHPGELLLKWPNDLMLAGAKLAGILLERDGDTVIAGIGVNLAYAPDIPGRHTISLAQFGPAPDRDGFAADLARNFADGLARWRADGPASTIALWLAAAHPEGTPLTLHAVDGEKVGGAFAGLEADGGLRLRLADGALRVIHAGDIMLEDH